jgi:hypothetical protein
VTSIPTFGATGGYPIKLGWLPKIHAAVLADPYVFERDDAPTLLGVGTSQVRAMRFWSLAGGLTLRVPKPRGIAVTARGRWLLDPDGADPWLESPETWWLLHWWILEAPSRLPAFRQLFNSWPFANFARDRYRQAVIREASQLRGSKPSKTGLDHDLTALVCNYASVQPTEDAPLRRGALEDEITTPMRQLRLLSHDGQRLQLHRDAGHLIPAAIVTYACLDYAHRRHPGPGSISLHQLLDGDGAPGRILALRPEALTRALAASARHWPQLALVEGNGARLHFGDEPLSLAWSILNRHYRHEPPPDARPELAPRGAPGQNTLF